MATPSAELTPDSFMQSQGAPGKSKDLTPDDFMQQQAKPAPEVTSAIDAAIKTVPQPKPQMQTMPLMERQPGTNYRAMDPKADAAYQQQEAQKFTEEIGAAVPDAATKPLAAVTHKAIDPFNKYVGDVGTGVGSTVEHAALGVPEAVPNMPADERAYRQQQMGGKGLETPQQAETEMAAGRKQHPVVAGVTRAAGELLGQTAADPRQWPLLFTGSAELKPLFAKLMSGGFAVQMGTDAAENSNDLINNWDKYTPDQRVEKIASTGLTSLFAAMATAHAASPHGAPGHEASKEPPVQEPARQLAPPATGEPVAPASGAVEKPVQASENLNPDTFMQEEENAVRPGDAQVQARPTPVVERGEGPRPQAGAGDNGVGKESSGERQAGVPAGAEAGRPVPKVTKTRLQTAKDIDRVGSGKVAATELTEGYEPKVEKGSKPRYQIAQLEDGRRVAYNPSKTNEQTVKEHAAKNELYKLTGDKPPQEKIDEARGVTTHQGAEEPERADAVPEGTTRSGAGGDTSQTVSDVILARHGETKLDQKGAKDTIAGWTAEPLDERGKKSAAAMAKELQPEPVSHIVTSDLERAKQTAAIVGDKLGVPVTEDSRLRPQHTPETEGKQMGEAKPIHDYYVEHPDERPNGGETYNETLARQRAAISDAKAGSKNGEKPVVLTHSRNIEAELGKTPEPGGVVKSGALEGEVQSPRAQLEAVKEELRGQYPHTPDDKLEQMAREQLHHEQTHPPFLGKEREVIGDRTSKPRTPGEPLEHGFDFSPAEDRGQQARDAVQKTQGALPRGERRKIERTPDEQATQKYFAQARKELGEEATSDQVMARVGELKKKVTPDRVDSGRDKILESEIKHLKDQAAEVSKQVSKQGYYDPATKPLAEKYNQLLKQVREREDELARLKGEPTRSEKRDLQQKEAEKPFAERPQEPLTYGDTRQSQHWQVAEPDYIAKRFEDKIKSYERAVAESRGEVASSKAGSKKHADAEMNLKYRKDMLERYQAKDPRLAQSFKTEYTELTKKAVSQGKPVPQSVIDQRPEFKLAQDARERYEKGRHTSFANKSAAINDTMQKEEGFKVKRQDGKPITEAQMKEISDGVNDIVKVLGEPLRDAMRGTDLTIAHTSGKNPFLTVAGGLYHPVDRTISVGINDVLGRPVKAQAHEMGHWFDYESGRAIGVKNRIYTKGGKGHETQYLSESDTAKQLYDLARRTMTDTREVQRMLKVVKLSDLPETERAEVERVKVVLGPYWRESREVFARMFEQYISDELGRTSPAAEDIGSYYKHPGWWSKEAWEKLKPMMAEEIKKRAEALKERYAPTEQAAPAITPPQTAGDKSNPEFGQAKRELYPDKKELSDAEVSKVIDRAAQIAKVKKAGKSLSEKWAKEDAERKPKPESLETRALREGAQPVKPVENVPKEGKNFEGRYVEAALTTAQEAWEKASEKYANHTISWNKITDSRLEDRDGVQVNLHDPSGNYVASLNVHKTQNGFEILAKGTLKEPVGKYGGNDVWQKITETASLAEAKKVAEARLRSGQVYSATDPWYGAGYSKSPDIPFAKVRPYSTIDPSDTRPAAFPKDKLLVKVPDDGTFVVPNNPASIAKAIKATEGFVPEKTPSSFAPRISKSPSDFNTEKYIVGLEKEVTELEDQITKANTLQKPHLEEELKAARENLADAKKQTPETLSKRIVPGARSAATGNETGTTSIQDLTDSIRRQVPDKRPLKDRLNRGAQIGEQMESAKDSVSRTYARIKGAASALWDAVSRPAPYTQYEDATGKWQGADQINAHDLMGFTEAIKKAVPDKLHREAISNWIEAGGDDKILRERAAKSQAAYKKGYEQALKLTDAEKTIARNVMNRNDATLEEAQKAGILQQGVENYVRHVYADDPKMQAKVNAEMNFNSLKTKPSFTKERKIPTYFDAEQLGFTPKDKDVGYLTAIHERSFREALAARAYIRSLMEGKAEDGRPLVQTAWSSAKEIEAKDGEGSAAYLVKPNIKAEEEYADYRRIDHPALRGWRWAGKTDSGEPIFVQGDALVHPEIYAKLRNNLGRSAIRSYEMTVAGRTFHPGAAVLNVSSQVKHAILSFSGFHQTTLGMHALEHRTLPAGMSDLDLGDAKQRSLVEHGLMVAQYDAEEAFGEGVASGGIVTKVPGIGPLYGHYVNYLFHDYLPRVKMAVALNALDRNFERYGEKLKSGKITEGQIYRITSEQTNAAFGGLNYRMLGRNKTMQDVLRLGLMAPDFFEARARYTGQAAKPYGREQTVALLGGAVVLYTLGRLLNQALDDDPHWDKPFAIVHKGREYAMRTIQQDIFNALTDPAKYFMARLSPLVSTSIHLGEGRNQFGRKQSLGQAVKETAKSEVPIPLQPWVRKSHDSNAQKAIESIGKMVGVNVKKAGPHHRRERVKLH